MKRKILSATGGGTKFGQLKEWTQAILNKGYEPTDYVGISASAILFFVIQFGLWQEMDFEALNIKLERFFSQAPVNRKGGISWKAIWRSIKSFLFKKDRYYSLGMQDVTELIKDYISEEMFQKWKKEKGPNVWVVATDLYSQQPKFHNLKNCETLPEAIQCINASSNIAPFAQDIQGQVDGGISLVNAASYMVEYEIIEEVEELVSIYAFEDPFLRKFESNSNWHQNTAAYAGRTMEVMGSWKKWAFVNLEVYLCHRKEVTLHQFFCDDILQSPYDTDKNRLHRSIFKTRERANKQLSTHQFLS